MKIKQKAGRTGAKEEHLRLSDLDIKNLISRTIKGEDEIDILDEIAGKGRFNRKQLNAKLHTIKKKENYQTIYAEYKRQIENNLKRDLSWTIERATENLLVIVEAAKTIIADDLEIKFETVTQYDKDKRESVLVWAKDPDGHRIKKRRRLSMAATTALTEAARELNKVHKLTEVANAADIKPVYFEGEADIQD